MLSFFLLCLLYLRVSQWEGTPGEAAVRVTAGGGLPACRAGGTAGLITRAPETAGPPEAAEGGSGDAAGTPAHRGPERVQHERGRMTITQHTPRHPWLFSSPVCLEFRSVTHVILLPAMHPDDIWMKCKWFTLHYCTHARRKPFFFLCLKVSFASKNLISWELEQDMRYSKKVTPTVVWPLAPTFHHISKWRWITVQGICL